MIGGTAGRLTGAGLLGMLVTGTALAAPPGPGFAPIQLTATPIAEFLTGTPETRFGLVEYRGGLSLFSTDPEFGSLSGLDFSADGTTVYAVTDTGFWFAARPLRREGRLVGLDDAVMAPILGSDGKPLSGKQQSDAEALRIVERDGREAALVTFEQVNDLRMFVASPTFAEARAIPVGLPASVRGNRQNGGLEAVAVAPAGGALAGATIVIAEHWLDGAGNHRGWIMGGPMDGPFSVERTRDFDVTDAAFLPDGDLLVLERKFNWSDGLVMRLRRVAEAQLRPGTTADGTFLVEADLRYQIDNMEGLAVRTDAAGETLVALVSDNNHNLLQRTLLLEFALIPTPTPMPRERPR